MTDSDLERTAQACRAYEVLLNFYPASFRLAYGDILVQHFRDECRNALVSRKRFPLLHFWVFILFDFLRSLLMEVQEEVVKMVKKNFYVYSGIIASVATFLRVVSVPFDFNHLFTGSWIIMFILGALYMIFGSITLVGFVRKTLPNLFFRMLSILALIFGVFVTGVLILSVILSFKQWNWAIHLMNFMFRMSIIVYEPIAIIDYGYHIVFAVIGIGFLVKQKWLFAAFMFMIPLPFLVPHTRILLDHYLWSFIPTFTLSSIAWFVIAWWLKKEREEISQPGRLEAA
jgi:hypothetical protein